MSIGKMALIVFLSLIAVASFGWVIIPGWVIGLSALIAAILLVVDDKYWVRR